MSGTDKEKLLSFIHEVGFAIDDVVLYLDTHPQDKQAMEYYETYRRLRNQAVEEYTRLYGPLTNENVAFGSYWAWVSTPWPWEGGCK
ncbi:spore coat protein CotJB [Acetivibrio ethanolgignens]|uniref:Protein CotJB domain-containing protein n=1 Tax=Acetivibrio ethanolgignens TaxID=290052 RepID=A0A0V8QID5_9FIRM|nr:spore coat protein CotJB [Acetivibrio ethanolgignens]KSV60321.1 hypothetical protein ASU35_06105 [Acetivibrio ethanolgignens]